MPLPKPRPTRPASRAPSAPSHDALRFCADFTKQTHRENLNPSPHLHLQIRAFKKQSQSNPILLPHHLPLPPFPALALCIHPSGVYLRYPSCLSCQRMLLGATGCYIHTSSQSAIGKPVEPGGCMSPPFRATISRRTVLAAARAAMGDYAHSTRSCRFNRPSWRPTPAAGRPGRRRSGARSSRGRRRRSSRGRRAGCRRHNWHSAW